MNIESTVLNSGIFQLGLSGIPDLPVGVYILLGPRDNKQLSKKNIVSNVDVLVLLCELETILDCYGWPAPKKLKETIIEIKEESNKILKEIEEKFEKILIENYQFTKKEAVESVKELSQKGKFKKLVREKIQAENNPEYFWLWVPLYRCFRKHLSTHESDTFWYLAHFLVGCGIEKGPVKTAYSRIQGKRKYIESGDKSRRVGKSEDNPYKQHLRDFSEKKDGLPL